MKDKKRIIILIGCIVLVIIAWASAISTTGAAERQLSLIAKAQELINDGIYIYAVPLLEEAAGYNSLHTLNAENKLKEVYLYLIDNRGYARRYTNLLDKQMSRKDCTADIFMEAAEYYISTNAKQTAFEILRNAIARTGNSEAADMYESYRYAYEINRTAYDYVTAIYNQTAVVRQNDSWGIANTDGTILIPCLYDKTSTFSQNRVIVEKSGIIYAVDGNNNRIALASGMVVDFKNLSENRVPVLIDDKWYRATGAFDIGENAFEDLGMYHDGYTAAKINGRWGVIDIITNWLIPAQYDEIISDELGRCYAQDAVFARSGDEVYLYLKGIRLNNTYQDARPFSDEGYAAVKKDNKWGFIDTEGNIKIDYFYDDALSFGEHLAGVKIGQMWGYININGRLVIDTVFVEAKSFSGGSAPVLTERGWQFITLIEYKKGATL